jgi:cell division protein FtsI (penicillin-binding protein 3)
MEQRPRRASNARVVSVGVLLVIAWSLVGYRLTVVQGARAQEFAARGLEQRVRGETLAADRGTIFDRDGRELAVSVEGTTIYANPHEIGDPETTASLLAPLLGRNPTDLAQELASDAAFVYLVRQLDPVDAEPVREAALDGIHFLTEPRRVYPSGELAAHVVGFVQDGDNSGLEGIELFYDTALAGTPGALVVERDPYGRVIPQGDYLVEPAEQGSDLVLTIKSEIQFAATIALAEALDRTGAVAGSIVVLDPETGQILAMANLPTFDPNDRADAPVENLRNRAVTDLFEPGSTQKAVTISGALESDVVQPTTSFVIPDTIEILDTVFKDVTIHPDQLTVTEIVAHSSNLGTILVGDLLGTRSLYTYMYAFGQGRQSGIDFPGEAPGVLHPPEDWCLTTCLAGTSIGYHVSVTPLQMAMVYATVANDGMWVQPHLVSEIVDGTGSRNPTSPLARRVISAETAGELRIMLEAVVDRGTGSQAAVSGYRVGGKTGTTEKYLADEQAYSTEDVVASFIGMAPIDDPKVVIAVVLDSPVNDASGGKGAAPVFAEVMLAALHQVGAVPSG